MLANNGGANQVWQSNSSGANPTTRRGRHSGYQMAASGDELFMVANNGGVDQVWRYNGSGTSWTAVSWSDISLANPVAA